MKLSLQRSQKSGFTGKATYSLLVRAQLTEDEKNIINRNNLGRELLVYHDKTGAADSLAGAIIKTMRDTALTVEGLYNGTTFTCKNVAEMMGIEDEVREAALRLRTIIELARNFGGEEVIDVDDQFEQEVLGKKK